MKKKYLIALVFSLLISFISVTSAQTANDTSEQTVIKYLSGVDKDNTVDWAFMVSSGAKSGQWSKIPVPSNWETKGFGTYHYGWEEDFKKNEIGYYKHPFKTDANWKNKRVKIVFEGSMTDTEVKVNGKSAGAVHQGSFYKFKYDITDLLKSEGENLLEVKVSKISADTSVNRAERMSDFWVFGGIFRPVYLEILPEQYIEWTAINASASGDFSIDVYTEHVKQPLKVEVQIKTLAGKKIGDPLSTSIDKNADKTTVRTKVDKPDLWTPEFPNRYQVEVKLKDNKGTVIHTKIEKFGFRTAELRKGIGFFVNGTKVRFKGVNRHSAWPTTGRTMSKTISELDVNLIKDMNMNAVRMSHYPPDSHFLDVCDSLGLFVIDELTGWQKKYDTPVGRKLLKEMIMKDMNHPSIVLWANGNEGGNNHDLVPDYAQYDPQKRTVIHPWNIFDGTDTQHYKGYDCCAGSLFQGNDVFFPTEFLHGLYDGGHGAGLDDYWKLMLSNPLSAGGFLWVFADEGVVRLDQGGHIDVKGNNAPDGILGPYREKEASFFAIKETWSPIYIDRKKLQLGFDGKLAVENRYHYTNLNQIQFKWILSKLPSAYEQDTIGKVIEQGAFNGPTVLPQQSGWLNIPLTNEQIDNADLLSLTATDIYGREIYTWTWPLKFPVEMNRKWISETKHGKPSLNEDAKLITIQAADVSIAFNKHTGMLDQVKSAGKIIPLTNGPQLAVGESTFLSLSHYERNDSIFVEMSYKGALKKVQYIMTSNGLLTLNYAYSVYNSNPSNTFEYLGINFDFPEEKITGVKYMGRGPYRVWKNRMQGNTFGVWKKKYNNTITGESWDYPEFKGYYRDFNWVVIENTEKPFVIYSFTNDLFLRLYTPEKAKGARNDFNSPPFPEGNISFLNGISAIGTKFDAATNHGPESQPNKVGAAWIEGKLIFDFVAKGISL